MTESVEDRSPHEIQKPLSDVAELTRRLCIGERIFETMTDTLSDIVFRTRPDGTWTYCSARMYEITGAPPNSILQDGWTNHLHPDDLVRVIGEFKDAVSLKAQFESHFRLLTSDCSYRRFIAKAQPVRGDADDVIEWIGTASDVHDLVSAEDALDEINRENAAFFRRVMHDLRNIIAPFQNAVRVLQIPESNESQRQRALEILDGQVKSLNAFLDSTQHFTPTYLRS